MISRDKVQIVGHRGWRSRFPDNTLEGIVACAEVADMAEIDVRRTADGRLVLAHDPELGGRVVAGTPWAQLAQLDLGDGMHPVLLDDVLQRLPDFPLNLEVKNDPTQPGFEPDGALGLDTAAWARSGDLITSFWWPTVDAIHRAFPTLATGLLAEPSIDLGSVLDHAVAAGHGTIAPHWSMLIATPEFVGEAHAEGVRVVTWTVNDDDVARQLAEAGVDAIITDDPGRLVATLGAYR